MLSKVGERSSVIKNFSNVQNEKSHFSAITSIRNAKNSMLSKEIDVGGGSQTSRVVRKHRKVEELYVRKKKVKEKEDHVAWMKNEFKEQ